MTIRRRFLAEADGEETSFLGALLRSETVGGSIALVAALVAIVWANLDFASYSGFRGWQLGPLDVEEWASDGALTVFFFVAGLELKRELLVGSLRRPADAAVPVFAACCGVALPALIFVVVNRGTDNLGGWAVPAATDIAFALAILSVVGSALPTQLRAFLLTLAVVDDLIVIVVIAVFYTSTIHLPALLVCAAAFAAYAVLQRLRVRSSVLYLPIAVLAWAAMHESGVHATIAGVVLGLLTRVVPDEGEARSPAERLEHRIAPLSSAVAVPFFALLSAGVQLTGGTALLGEPLVLGVVLGLVLGKPVGVLGGTWLITRFTRAELNEGLGWRDLAGVGVVAGVGFTVSLLVSDLAFTGSDREQAKTAVLLASLIAGLAGALVLGRRNRRHRGA
ncbi:MAG: Na+/H+ antiporter NhaA [Marmoricola sp.]|nr:Na+/H+ antiporter NhaA [Marmoricola sp.]